MYNINQFVRVNSLTLLLLVLFVFLLLIENLSGQTASDTPKRSGASYRNSRRSAAGVDLGPYYSLKSKLPPSGIEAITETFEGFDFDDNAFENSGFLFIPSDPIGAAGTDRVIAVVNTMIEARDKTGTLLWRDSLEDFFAPAPAPGVLGTFAFDPKVVYDHYEDRFVVVTLERNDTADGDPSNESRILLAVSKTGSPASPTAADWFYHAIDSKTTVGAMPCWADYPGFEVDEEAVYVTNNLFEFDSAGGGACGEQRLDIVHKGVGTGGFYDGGAAIGTFHLLGATTGGFSLTTMPALIFGTGGIPGAVPGGVGTFLVGYDGLTVGGVGGSEFLQIIRVDDPLGTAGGPAFTLDTIPIGDIEDVGGVFGFPALLDAPQRDTTITIEVNDRRLLDCTWRNDSLWCTTTIEPNSGPDAGETTAHWFKVDTSPVPGGPPVVADQGDIGGEDIADGTFTYFPAVAVNGIWRREIWFFSFEFNDLCRRLCYRAQTR